jgi:hypothetical protein
MGFDSVCIGKFDYFSSGLISFRGRIFVFKKAAMLLTDEEIDIRERKVKCKVKDVVSLTVRH